MDSGARYRVSSAELILLLAKQLVLREARTLRLQLLAAPAAVDSNTVSTRLFCRRADARLSELVVLLVLNSFSRVAWFGPNEHFARQLIYRAKRPKAH